jgi:hypothetical protein
MTIFDFISSTLFTKQKTCLNSVDEEGEFSPYMLNRWASMYSPSVAVVCNVLNKYLGVFESKRDLYNLFVAALPKVSSRRIMYIKKVKETKKEENPDIELVASNLELSEREINEYIAFKQNLTN